jgi:hypothetical protein
MGIAARRIEENIRRKADTNGHEPQYSRLLQEKGKHTISPRRLPRKIKVSPRKGFKYIHY